jgi:hypothetical protein
MLTRNTGNAFRRQFRQRFHELEKEFTSDNFASSCFMLPNIANSTIETIIPALFSK